MDELAARIRERRKELGLTQADLAVRVGVKPLAVTNWERGESRPWESLVTLAGILGVSTDWLLTGKDSLARAEGVPLSAVKYPSGVSIERARQGLSALQKLLSELEMQETQAESVPPPTPAPPTPKESLTRLPRPKGELIVFPMARDGEGLPVPHWLGAAAGPGRDLERADEGVVLKGVRNREGLHTATVRGESMQPTFPAGTVVVMREYPGGGLDIPPRGSAPKSPIDWLRADVPEGSVCLVSINAEEPTLKRLTYTKPPDWRVVIVADNPAVWKDRPITRRDHLRVFARVLGVGRVE